MAIRLAGIADEVKREAQLRLRPNFRTVGDLVDAARKGLGKLRNFGAKARLETVHALQTLSRTVTDDGNVDWVQFAVNLGYEIIPAEAGANRIGAFVDEVLPDACKTLITSQFKDREWDIFQKRWLVSEEGAETLKRIGDDYGLSRERIRQLESLCLDAIRAPLVHGDFRKLKYRFRSEFIRLFNDASEHFQSVGLAARSKEKWIGELAQLWQTAPESLAANYRLLAQILGFQSVQLQHSELDSIVLEQSITDREKHRFATLVDAIHAALVGGKVMDATQLANSLQQSKKPLMDIGEIPVLVGLCSSVETTKEDRYQIRFEFLGGRTNQAFRVLEETGTPLHCNDLVQEINRRLPPDKRVSRKQTLVNQMASDDRIEPIGRTGKWALTAWNLETRSLVNLLEETLKAAGKPMTIDQLSSIALKNRQGSTNSISILLRNSPERFKQVAFKTYALTSWSGIVTDFPFAANDVGQFVEDFFRGSSVDRVPFAVLASAFSLKSSFPTRSARGVLVHHPAVIVERTDRRKRMASYNAGWRDQNSNTAK